MKHNGLVAELNSLLVRPESEFGVNGKEKKEYEIDQVKRNIAAIEREIEKVKEKSGKPDWVNCPVCQATFNKNTEV